jgi:3-oxoacyl-(acyl-carrier-protein) synthase
MQDAKLTASSNHRAELGVAIGTAYSGHQDFSQASALVLGGKPELVNPGRTPEAGYNAPASHISIRIKAEGLNVTLAAGHSSAIEALRLGMEQIRAGRMKAVMTGGVDVLSDHLVRYGQTSISNAGDITLSEAAVCLLLEQQDEAHSRGVPIAALLQAADLRYTALKGQALADHMELVLRECIASAGLRPSQVDAVFMSGNGYDDSHRVEASAINRVFGSNTPVCAAKAVTGECYAASGALIAATAVIALNKRAIPPPLDHATPPSGWPELILSRYDPSLPLRYIVTTQLDEDGYAGALVLSAPDV